MSEKEKARTGAAASGRAMKCDSGINYSTEARASQGWIVDFLLIGRENAQTGRDLARISGHPLKGRRTCAAARSADLRVYRRESRLLSGTGRGGSYALYQCFIASQGG